MVKRTNFRIFKTKGITDMLNGMKAKALLIGTMAISILISGCGVKKDSDDKVMLQIGKNITEVNSAGQKKLLDKGGAGYWQYDPDDKLLIASRTTVQIYSLETGAITNIGKDMLYDFKYEEQKMISTFFDILAKEIISVQTKLDKLYALKKTMLVKMFPQGDALVPEIRLKGFTGEWKCSPAKEIFKSVADKNHPDLPVLSASQEFGMIKRDEVGKIVAHDKSSEATYKRVLPGQFVIHLRSFQGGFAHSAYEGITSPAYTVMDFKEKELHDDMYWKYVFMTKMFIIRLETVTYGIRDGRSISFADYSSLEMKYPDVREQATIGQYFQTLDKQLRLYEQKLSKLKNLKFAFLKNMFV